MKVSFISSLLHGMLLDNARQNTLKNKRLEYVSTPISMPDGSESILTEYVYLWHVVEAMSWPGYWAYEHMSMDQVECAVQLMGEISSN